MAPIATHHPVNSEAEVEALSGAPDSDETTRQQQALSDATAALEDSDTASKALAAEFDAEKQAREAAEKELAEATGSVESLNEQNRKLQETVDGLETRLKAADARAADTASLEKDAALLQDEVAARRASWMPCSSNWDRRGRSWSR